MYAPLSSDAARRHPPTASADAIRAACEARAAAAALARGEGREAVPCETVVNHAPAVGGFHPERNPGPALGTSGREMLRDWAGPVAQIAAPLMLAALAFLL